MSPRHSLSKIVTWTTILMLPHPNNKAQIAPTCQREQRITWFKMFPCLFLTILNFNFAFIAFNFLLVILTKKVNFVSLNIEMSFLFFVIRRKSWSAIQVRQLVFFKYLWKVLGVKPYESCVFSSVCVKCNHFVLLVEKSQLKICWI